jgi:hypothetical protein
MYSNPIETPFRLRILIGESETLSAWIATCPDCGRSFRLQWPNSVLQIPLHRVVDLLCPHCAEAITLVAASLVPDEEGAELRTGVVERMA